MCLAPTYIDRHVMDLPVHASCQYFEIRAQSNRARADCVQGSPEPDHEEMKIEYQKWNEQGECMSTN